MKYYRHITPPCKNCGSEATGRYIFGQSTRNTGLLEYISEKKAAKKGELIRYKPQEESQFENNIFCSECGIEWRGQIIGAWLTKEELNLYKSITNAEEVQKEYLMDIDIRMESKKEKTKRKTKFFTRKKKKEVVNKIDLLKEINDLKEGFKGKI